MLLVYTHKITPRLTYVFKHIVKRILGIPVEFTTTIEAFIAHNGLKLSYTKQPLSNELFIRSNELLFEVGFSDVEINVQKWDDTVGFFVTSERSHLPYDIFAASFYLISRYEEYLPHVKDDYGRYSATESLAFKNNFLNQPVVDIWAYKFKSILHVRFPEFEFPSQTFKVIPLIDVPMAYLFKNKGMIRTIGGVLNDVYKLNFKQLSRRIMVMLKIKRDNYDTFDTLKELQKQTEISFLFLFLIGKFSSYDKNISINKSEFRSLIKSVGDYSRIGLKFSFASIDHLEIMKEEKNKFNMVTNRKTNVSRNSYSKVNLPQAYRNLLELDIEEDYTMGYVNYLGFRAGTCTPFYFYDLDYEIETPLKIYGYHCNDYALLKHKSLLDKTETLNKLITSIKNVNGTFISVFHNYTFSDDLRWDGFESLFKIILNTNNHA
ncbi:polysaccharide deacetylase family protein [Paucihalobacter sp.]|uniref:polysaccharide deacetylase family protein n=1 Tax=Paucihalobacter sp. TaxID=2850405 RepID=UPI002FE3B41D